MALVFIGSPFVVCAGDLPAQPPPDGEARAAADPALGVPQDPEGILEWARVQEDGEVAEKLYLSILSDFPESPFADDALFALAMEHYSLGYHQRAEREFRRVVDEYPDSDRAEDAGYWNGVALLAVGDLDRAAERFQWLIDRYPPSEKSAWARNGLGDCFRLRGEFPLAAQTYEEMLTTFPSADSESATLFHLAGVYEEMHEDAKALGLYVRLSKAYPETYEGVQAQAMAKGLSAVVGPATGDSAAASPARPESEADRGSKPPAAPDPDTAGEVGESWTVQVGAFGVEENATRLVRVLEAHGYRDVRIRTEPSGTSPLYRVWVGIFSSESDARTTARILRDRDHLETAVLLYRPGSIPVR